MSLGRLFPPSRLPAMKAQLLRFAAGFGVTDMTMPEHMPNTRRVLAAAEFARASGALDAFREAAMDAHWKEAKNLEDVKVLEELARRAGLDPADTLDASRDPAWVGKVLETREDGERAGITGIPTFFIGEQRIVGCQPYELLAGVVRRTGA